MAAPWPARQLSHSQHAARAKGTQEARDVGGDTTSRICRCARAAGGERGGRPGRAALGCSARPGRRACGSARMPRPAAHRAARPDALAPGRCPAPVPTCGMYG
eukprot:scaffold705_cov402-Prasinococcus_capsulatus_cf.AAC.50